MIRTMIMTTTTPTLQSHTVKSNAKRQTTFKLIFTNNPTQSQPKGIAEDSDFFKLPVFVTDASNFFVTYIAPFNQLRHQRQ